MKFLITLIITTCLSACGQKTPEHLYFPLDKGMQWDYQVTAFRPEGDITKNLTIRNLGKTVFDGGTAYLRRTSNGTDYYLSSDNSGIKRIAKRSIIEASATKDSKSRIVLPAVNTFSNKLEWNVPSVPYALFRVKPYIEAVGKDRVNIDMTYTVQSTSETITTLAGTFQNCLILKAHGQLSIYVDPTIGHKEIDIISREWYAPNVGLVKLERKEILDTEIFQGGTVTLNLKRFKK